MRMVTDQRGFGKFKVILFIALLFGAVHVGFKVLPIYLDYWSMEDEIEGKAGAAQALKEDEIRYALYGKALERKMGLTLEDFKVVKDEEGRTISISVAWSRDIELFWGVCGEPCKRHYRFAPSVRGTY